MDPSPHSAHKRCPWQVTSLATLQLLMAVWSTCGDPSDRLLSTMASISSSLECSASLCLLAAHLSDDTQLAARLASTGIELFKVRVAASARAPFF